jgi:hypothetical protein
MTSKSGTDNELDTGSVKETLSRRLVRGLADVVVGISHNGDQVVALSGHADVGLNLVKCSREIVATPHSLQ